jgi:hypothetical protein
MNCTTCSTEMKLLFTGYYCPNDCDRGGVSSADVNPEELPLSSMQFYGCYVSSQCNGGIIDRDFLAFKRLSDALNFSEQYGPLYETWLVECKRIHWVAPTKASLTTVKLIRRVSSK